MAVPPDNTCCFCLTLRTGVIIIGIFNFTLYLLAFLWYVGISITQEDLAEILSLG
jgi:hypothetical protein